MSLTGRSAPKPRSGTSAAKEPPVCSGRPRCSSVGPSWERRVGSFVSSTRLSIRPRPLGSEKSGAEESHGGPAADACGEENQGKRVVVQPQDGGDLPPVSPRRGVCEQHSRTSRFLGGADAGHVLGTPR